MENDKINEDAFMSTAVEVNAWCTDVKERVSYAGRTRTTHYDAYFTYDYLDKSYNTCITDSG